MADRSPAGGTQPPPHAPALELARPQSGSTPPVQTTEQLAELLHLPDVGRSIKTARITGQGARASVDLVLDDDTTLMFESVKDFAHPGRMALELAMGAGVEATFKAPQLIKAVTLLRAIADQQAAVTSDDMSRELGCTFLQSATRHDVDFNDQAARWEAFCMLERFDPIASTRRDPVTIAQASVVLHDQGTRYVRCSWFGSHFRRENPTASPQEVAHRMQRVGWLRRGREGRIKATPPARKGQLAWSGQVGRSGVAGARRAGLK